MCAILFIIRDFFGLLIVMVTFALSFSLRNNYHIRNTESNVYLFLIIINTVIITKININIKKPPIKPPTIETKIIMNQLNG